MVKIFGLQIWIKNSYSCGKSFLEFTSPKPGCIHPYGHLPSLVDLFENLVSKIAEKYS